MALVYGNEATDLFFGLLDNTVVTDVPYSHPQDTLEQAILDAGSGHVCLRRLPQTALLYAGVMPDADAVMRSKGCRRDGQPSTTAVDELYTRRSRAFFDRYPELLPLYD